MWFTVTVWDIDNNRHVAKCYDYDDAVATADAAYANGAEYAVVSNSHTGVELYDATGEN